MTERINQIAPPLNHEKNISIGVARIIWIGATHTTQAGWVLPGCEVTQDYDVALGAAEAINHAAAIWEARRKRMCSINAMAQPVSA